MDRLWSDLQSLLWEAHLVKVSLKFTLINSHFTIFTCISLPLTLTQPSHAHDFINWSWFDWVNGFFPETNFHAWKTSERRGLGNRIVWQTSSRHRHYVNKFVSWLYCYQLMYRVFRSLTFKLKLKRSAPIFHYLPCAIICKGGHWHWLWVLSLESPLGGNVRRHKIRGYRAALTLRIRNKARARRKAKTDEINRRKMKIYQQHRDLLQREVASRNPGQRRILSEKFFIQ